MSAARHRNPGEADQRSARRRPGTKHKEMHSTYKSIERERKAMEEILGWAPAGFMVVRELGQYS